MASPGPTRPRQLAFDLAGRPSFDADDFLVTPANADAHALIARWPRWPSRSLLLLGPSGCGKSHLGAIWAARARAAVLRRGDELDPSLWKDAVPTVWIDDCGPSAYAEAGLFHLLNLAAERGGWLLLAAERPPDRWGIVTADLRSRLRHCAVAQVHAPDDLLIRAVMVKLFADRQIMVDDDVVAYAARRCERSLASVARFVAAIDVTALEGGRRITKPLAGHVLSTLEGEGRATPQASDEPD